MNNNTSDEDKHDTNCINNKYTNTYTRKLHNQWARHLERAVSLIYSWHKVQENHAGIGSYRRSDPRDGQTGERGPHPHCHRRRTERIQWQLVDTFELCGFRHDAHKASPWLQTSVVNLASPKESRGLGLLPKTVAKLFLIVVAMARFLVASLTWDITTTMDLTLIERGNLCTQCINYSCVAWISARIGCTIYSDYIGNSQRSSLSPTGGVKSTSPVTENHDSEHHNTKGRKRTQLRSANMFEVFLLFPARNFRSRSKQTMGCAHTWMSGRAYESSLSMSRLVYMKTSAMLWQCGWSNTNMF